MLKSSRLTLKLPSMTDAPNMAEYLNRQDTAGMMGHIPMPYTLADAETFITYIMSSPADEMVTGIFNEQDKFIGVISIRQTDRGHSLGYWIGHPFWGKGYMTEACILFINNFFSTINAEFLLVSHFLINPASEVIINKLGFKYQQTVTYEIPLRNTQEKAKRYKLTKQDWNAKNEN
ncbi:MAG: GNAT family N-acetyltransferase [OCS116 cluster bacterium]|nr:GNAT family N-acetyltransferase [OCS116 cluster bacterium]